ncbi:MAG: hypothetical protein LBT62_04150, partial [Deltaproteobacteria bacterium]|nr:hypothetical protein [Deltaproteobacteria bacterium]
MAQPQLHDINRSKSIFAVSIFNVSVAALLAICSAALVFGFGCNFSETTKTNQGPNQSLDQAPKIGSDIDLGSFLDLEGFQNLSNQAESRTPNQASGDVAHLTGDTEGRSQAQMNSKQQAQPGSESYAGSHVLAYANAGSYVPAYADAGSFAETFAAVEAGDQELSRSQLQSKNADDDLWLEVEPTVLTAWSVTDLTVRVRGGDEKESLGGKSLAFMTDPRWPNLRGITRSLDKEGKIRLKGLEVGAAEKTRLSAVVDGKTVSVWVDIKGPKYALKLIDLKHKSGRSYDAALVLLDGERNVGANVPFRFIGDKAFPNLRDVWRRTKEGGLIELKGLLIPRSIPSSIPRSIPGSIHGLIPGTIPGSNPGLDDEDVESAARSDSKIMTVKAQVGSRTPLIDLDVLGG